MVALKERLEKECSAIDDSGILMNQAKALTLLNAFQKEECPEAY